MTLKTIIEMNNTQEQKIVQKMVTEKKQTVSVDDMDLTDDSIKVLQDKGYIYDEDAKTVSTDYDESKINLKLLLNNMDSDNLKCHTIPVAARVRTYILKEQLKDSDPIIGTLREAIEKNSKTLIQQSKKDIPNEALYLEILKVLDLEVKSETETEYIIQES